MTRMICVATIAALAMPAALWAQTGAVTEASITSPTIEACYVKSSGTVYRINAPNTPSKCSTNGTAFSWNIQGAQGPVGPQGPQGPAGPSGVMGYEFRPNENTPAPIPAGAVETRTRFCLGGEVVTGGGFHTMVQHDDLQVVYSGPFHKAETNQYGWEVRVRNTSATTAATLIVVALCATPAT